MILALTGGIACGKSLVLKFFSTYNWDTADADRICHQFYDEKDPGLYRQFRQIWGEHFFDDKGEIDRRRLAQETFSQPCELEKLNSIIHPMFKLRVQELRKDVKQNNKKLIMEVPLLFEAGFESEFDAVVCVYSSESQQQQRLRRRENWNSTHIKQRIKAQWPIEKKLQLSDYAIINSGSVQLLEDQCRITDYNIRNQLHE